MISLGQHDYMWTFLAMKKHLGRLELHVGSAELS
jgi:hypothetical protein